MRTEVVIRFDADIASAKASLASPERDTLLYNAEETLWNCRVKEFGPLIVSIDAQGRNYFEEMKVEYNKNKDVQIEAISKQVGFIK